MTKASDNVFPRFLISEGGSTSTPASNRVTVYAKADGLLYSKDDAGVESQISPGPWTSYTPTVGSSGTPPTLGSSTIAGQYQLIAAKTMVLIIEMNITTGGSWNAGTGFWTFSLPSVTMPARRQLVYTHVSDANGERYVGTGVIASSGSTVAIASAWTANGGGNQIGATTPITWATGDYILLQGTLQLG